MRIAKRQATVRFTDTLRSSASPLSSCESGSCGSRTQLGQHHQNLQLSPGSSVVEQRTRNAQVMGSNPISGSCDHPSKTLSQQLSQPFVGQGLGRCAFMR